MRTTLPALLTASLLLAACDSNPDAGADADDERPALEIRVSEHRNDDDLLSAGLGLAGLAGPPPPLADPAAPTPAELRRLAIYKSWTGLQSFTPAGGLGGLLDELPAVPGREFSAFLTVPGAARPIRVVLQLPDAFDIAQACLTVAPASGSRGVYGAISLAGPMALVRGCAVVYTDKGAGTDIYDYATATGVSLDGTRSAPESAPLGFTPDLKGTPGETAAVALAHAHSGDNPEADWGRHVLAAARFGLDVLGDEFGDRLEVANTRIIAAGLSNGGGAVLRAAELDETGLLDGVIAVSPNITAPGARPLFDYATAAALYQPCLLADLKAIGQLPLGNPILAALGEPRCAALVRAGLLDEADSEAARARLVELGFESGALEQSAVNVALGLWRTVAATYASAYLRRGAFDMPCGFAYRAPAATQAQRNAWWALHSGIGAGEGIELVDAGGEGSDKQLSGLMCLRALWTGRSNESRELHAAIEATRASARLPSGLPVIVIHGADDGLIPAAFSARPWVEQARAAGADIAYWEVADAQHFDVLVGAPGVAGRYVPLLPYAWRAAEQLDAALDTGSFVGEDRRIRPALVPASEPLGWGGLGL